MCLEVRGGQPIQAGVANLEHPELPRVSHHPSRVRRVARSERVAPPVDEGRAVKGHRAVDGRAGDALRLQYGQAPGQQAVE